jgi:hypothetical protein
LSRVAPTGQELGHIPDPLIHLEKHGASEGQFVPGHGNVHAKADVQKRLTDAEAKGEKIKRLRKESRLRKFEA